MKNYYYLWMPLLFLLLFTSVFLNPENSFCQQTERRIIQGVLKDDTEDPLPGVNVVIKGTTIGTVTNIDGFYRIEASVGEILVYSSIGFVSHEVEVGPQNSDPIQNAVKKISQVDFAAYRKKDFAQSTTKKNTLSLDQDSQVFRFNYKNSSRWSRHGVPVETGKNYIFLPSSIKRIRYVGPEKLQRKYDIDHPKGIYEISEKRSAPYHRYIGFTYSTSFSSSSPYRLPELQTQFAQGRPQDGQPVWHGPDTGEIFSWGPQLSMLEFDGSPYPWDMNGKLVSLGTGNGVSANIYKPYDFFFRNGKNIHNYLKLGFPILDNFTSDFEIEHSLGSSFIPRSESEKIRSGLKLKYQGYRLDIDGNLSYGKNNHTLPAFGANHASILSSILRTPISFDNANGMNAKNAMENPDSYLLEDGSQRSYAYNQSDNPWWLINQLPDLSEQSHFLAGIKIDKSFWHDIDVSFSASYSAENLIRRFGYPSGSSANPHGRLTTRDQSNKLFSSLIDVHFRRYWNGFQLDAGQQNIITGDFKSLDRTDKMNLDHPGELLIKRQFSMERWSYEPGLLTKMQFGPGYYRNLFKINLYLNSYISNTLNDQFYVLPAVGASIDIDELLDLGSGISGIKIRGQFANSVKEAPLLYPSLSFNTLNFRSDQYAGYFENEEIFLTDSRNLQAEFHSKIETGIDLNFFYHVLNFQYNLYKNDVDDFIYPVLENGKFQLQNLARVTTVGHEIELELLKPIHGDFDISSKLTFHQYSPIVKKLYSQESYVPVSGFSDVFGAAMPDQPLGTLYGSKYMRDDEGEMIIGDHGYPLIDANPGSLGSPIPNWSGGFETALYFKTITLSILIETSQGGKVWNGTRNALNYLGKSTESAEFRNTTNFMFEGVNEAGEPNTVPVSFANQTESLEENRWVRYGFSGVAEEAMEDASWTKLSELKLSVDLSDLLQRLINSRLDASLSVFARDLFMISGYSGSNPAGTLFSYPALSGFDLFNAPIARTIGFSLTLKNQ